VGIDADTNAATFLTPTTAIELPQMPKRELADRILDEILTLRRPSPMVLELDDELHPQSGETQGEALPERRSTFEDEIVAASSRRQFIVE
jgi:hypothetical protein